jgi:stage II sporulation protein D
VRLFFVTFAFALAFLATNASGQAPPAPSDSTTGEAVFAVSGRGWGHGVGLSQWGAYGQAKAGRTYDQILAHYYFGTKLGRATKSEVRVLLAEGKRALTVQSTAPFRVRDAAGAVTKLPAGALILTPQLKLPNAAKASPGPLFVLPGKQPLSLDGRPYRGKLELASAGGYLRVVNYVGLEAYIAGVVADEMPYTWPLEALKAQAVAARTFALKSIVKGKPYDLFSDVRSQVYGGVASEELSATKAIQATAGQVVTYAGQLITAFYFSSSGGKTASAEDVFGTALPYLVSRPDPWDKASPNHRWGPVLLGARTLQSKLSVTARVLDASGVPTPSGRIRNLALRTPSGTTNVPASLVRTALGLRSTWITLGVLRLDRPKGTVESGVTLRLGGIARNVVAPQLQSSANGKTWTSVGPLERAADGTFAAAVTPARTTNYRIEAGSSASQPASRVTSQVLLVRVSPKIRLARPVERSVLSGTVRPRVGAVVHVERLRSGSWVHVGETLADGSGTFRVEAQIVPGTYRARTSPIAGFAEGISPLLAVD